MGIIKGFNMNEIETYIAIEVRDNISHKMLFKKFPIEELEKNLIGMENAIKHVELEMVMELKENRRT